MNQKNYDLMNWEEIESIIYGDCDTPGKILGVTTKGKKKLIQCFYPDAKEVTALLVKGGKKTNLKLEMVDEEGFFAEFTSVDFDAYELEIKYNKKSILQKDPYNYVVKLDEKAVKDILDGKSIKAYEIFGSHKKEIDGVTGYEFNLYAPNAQAVSLVGDFNNWNENANLMNKDSQGVFSLFIPELKDDSAYKYVIKSRGFKAYRNDPFALEIVNDNSICKDYTFETKTKSITKKDSELQILEVDLKKLIKKSKKKEKVISTILDSVKNYKYDTVSFLPVLKCKDTENYEVYNEYSFDKENGIDLATFKDICKELKKEKINLLLEIPFAYVSNDENGLSYFDGSHLFENEDYRLNSHNRYNAMLFDYSKPFTYSYIMSAVNLFMTNFDIDGITVPNAGIILYHDYNKNPGEYITEEWGNTVNSKGVNFLKEMNKSLHKNYKNAVSVASIYAYFNNVTGSDKDSLGFDFCVNSGATEEILDFFGKDSYTRNSYLDSFLLFTHFTNSAENYIYPFSKKENEKDYKTIFERMPGTDDEKLANIKLAIVFKHLMKGSQLSNIDVDSVSDSVNTKDFNKFLEEFRSIYTKYKDCIKSNENEPFKYKCVENQVVTREYFDGKSNIIVVFNFSNESFDEYRINVSKEGVYQEVFNTDDKKYGGKGIVNKKPVNTEDVVEDSSISLTVKVPALSVVAYSYREFTAEELEEMYQKNKKKAYDYVAKETDKINKKLEEDIANLKKEADIKLKELEMLLKPYDH